MDLFILRKGRRVIELDEDHFRALKNEYLGKPGVGVSVILPGDDPLPRSFRRIGAVGDRTVIHELRVPKGFAPKRLMPAWTFVAPRAFREAFFREWLEERDHLRTRGVSEGFIWFTVVTQLATFVWIGSKDRLLDLLGRVLGTPKG